MLGPLQDNGGPTFTHALLPGSPAINAGDPGFTPPPFFDQRGPGFDRVVNGRLDIGSFEVQGETRTPKLLQHQQLLRYLLLHRGQVQLQELLRHPGLASFRGLGRLHRNKGIEISRCNRDRSIPTARGPAEYLLGSTGCQPFRATNAKIRFRDALQELMCIRVHSWLVQAE